jgi:hypothetical protein
MAREVLGRQIVSKIYFGVILSPSWELSDATFLILGPWQDGRIFFWVE